MSEQQLEKFEAKALKLVKLAKGWKPCIISWETIEDDYGLDFTDEERDSIKRYWRRFFPANTEITVQWGIIIPQEKV